MSSLSRPESIRLPTYPGIGVIAEPLCGFPTARSRGRPDETGIVSRGHWGMTESDAETTFCGLAQACGRIEAYTQERCQFWVTDKAGQGRYVLEPLDLARRRELAEWLLEIRDRLDGSDDEAARRLFYERLNAGRSD